MRVLNSTIQGRCAFAEVEVEAEAEENLGNLLDRVVKVDRHENQATPASLCIARISRLFWTSPGQTDWHYCNFSAVYSLASRPLLLRR
jgi:hypothetical protein